MLQDLSAKRMWPREAKVERVFCNGVTGEFITSSSIKGQPKSTVFYLHGGGYCVGSCTSYRKAIANLSKCTQSRFLVLDYGRAPEHQFPFALNQAFEAYKWLLGQGVHPSELVIAGDSAGGGLSVSLMTLLRDKNVPLPSCAVLMSPWTDLSQDSCIQNPKLYNFEDIPFNENNLAVRFAAAYAGHEDLKNPLVSPYYANLEGLPPVLITVGGSEALLYDIEKFYRKCVEHKLQVEWDLEQHMPHVFQILHQELDPKVDDSLHRIKRFIWSNVQ